MSMVKSRSAQLIAMIAMAVAMILGTSALASAQEYPGGTSFTANDTNPECGTPVTLTGTGFTPDATVTLTHEGKSIGTVTADASGNFTFVWTPDCSLSGNQVVTANDGTHNMSITLAVRGKGTPPAPPTTVQPVTPLPRTGSSSTTVLAQVGIALIAAGGLIVLAVRKRSNRSGALGA